MTQFGNVATKPMPAPTIMYTATSVGGGGAADNGEFTLTGLGCAAFTYTHALPLSWASNGAMIPFTVKFDPQTPGPYSCTFNVVDNSDHTTVLGFITLTGTATAPVISTTPADGATIDFGDVAINTTVQRTITIGNTGNAALKVKTLDLGTPSTTYVVTHPSLPMTIPAGSSQEITVELTPGAVGVDSDTLLIGSDDPAKPTVTINLTGNGTNARMAVTDVNFGTVAAGGTGTGSMTISNVATGQQGQLVVTNASITAGSWFSFGANGGSCLNQPTCMFPGAGLIAPPNQTVTVQCKPPVGATGMQMGTVLFSSNSDASGDEVASLTCAAGVPNAVVMPASLAFGNQVVGTTSSTMPFVIMNTGTGPLTYSIAGGSTTFPVTAACSSNCTLSAGGMVSIDVAFHPSATGAASSMITVTSNDPDVADQTKNVMVSGTGIAPMIMMSMTSLDFMTVDVGGTKTLMVSATNNGSSPLSISSAGIVSTGDFSITAGMTGMQSVAVGASVMWSITCTPSAQGALSGTFRVASNAVGAPTTDVSLSCTGQRGKLVTNPVTSAGSPLQFNGVTVGNTSQKMFVLSNPGNVAVTGITSTLTGGVGYSIDASTPIPTMLAANGMFTVKVNFAPLAGSDGGPATLAITGSWGTGRTASVDVFIDGDGLVAGFDVTPSALAFGSLRWDTTGTAFFCIVNTDQAPVTVMNPITISPTAPTVTGEFAVTKVERNATCSASGGTTTALPQTLAMNDTLVVTITADPNNRTGALAATATVTTDLPSNPTRTVALTGMSTTPMLTTTPGLSVDFGGVDVDGADAMQTITIMNSGDGPLDLSGFAVTPMTSPFSLSLPADQTVPAGGHIDIVVTYSPTVEQAANQFDQVILSHNVGGVLGGPMNQMITIKGHGTDRHFSLGAVPSFPDTFKNPGSTAPIRTITVTNNGEAPLTINAEMVTNADVWQILDTVPVTIPGHGTHDFQVKFVPKTAGPAPEGDLIFTSNDNSTPAPVAEAKLNGNGLSRMVLMGDPVIDFGFTAIGIPVTRTVTVTSMDATHGFTIRAIDIDDEAFTIEEAPMNAALAAGETKTFTLTFTPTAEGDFATTAHLFLDEDPTVQAEVMLKGRAVFVEVTGSGGCSTSGGTGLAMVLVIGALVLRRRRAALAALSLIAALVIAPAVVRADTPDMDVDLSLFNPTPSTTGNGFQVQPATVGENGAFAAAATVSYATDPLVLHFAGDEHMAITQRTTLELGVAYAFLGRFEAGVRMPLYNQAGDGSMLGVDSPSGTVRGDLVLHAKAKAFEVSNLVGGIGVALTLPTASSHEFAGTGSPTGRVLALVTANPIPKLSLSANAGAVLRGKSELSNIEQGSGLVWGAGLSYQVIDPLWLTGELFGEVMPSGKTDAMGGSGALAPAEWLVGASYRPDPRFAIGVGAGRGLIAGLGTPSLRGVLSLSYVPGAPLPPPKSHHVEETPPPPPVVDSDGDGIPDADDKCPHEAEDKDMFDDTDGCPDPDNDGDGIPDTADKCPLDPEDKDGFEDTDGCPDKDNDADGVPDAQDKCPNEAEDKDGFDDIDGCPDLDNDGDGIPDAADKCPNEAEVINGNEDDDGCPDKGDQLVIVTPSGVELSEAVQFQGQTIAKASTNVLNQVAATLRAHAEIVRVKIVAHVQPTKDEAKDQDLSDKRAAAVAGFLVQAGIAPGRVSSAGMGGTKPLVPKTAKNAKMINDRVEVIILERK